jgi:regulator of protease activity HflC (stomatin/prohibitin superfamily)
VRFHPDPENVWKLHQEIGPDYVGKIVRPQTRSHVRMVVAQYPVIDVYGPRRARIIDQINARLRTLLAKNYVVLDEVLLRDVSFSPEFQGAIEQKQVAQQDVSRLAFERDRADKERRRKIIQAEGEAESIRLKAAALAQNPGLTQYEYVQNLPRNVKTLITDGRTIVNLGDVPLAAASTASEPSPTAVPRAPEPGTETNQ